MPHAKRSFNRTVKKLPVNSRVVVRLVSYDATFRRRIESTCINLKEYRYVVVCLTSLNWFSSGSHEHPGKRKER